MRFIYFCKDDNGIESSFLSKAFLEPGMRIPAANGKTTTIIDLQVERSISVYEDAMDIGY